MAKIKIHGVPPSTFTRTVRLACHEKAIDHELVPTMPSQVGLLNPFGKIPEFKFCAVRAEKIDIRTAAE